MSTIAVTRRETNGWKWPSFMLAYLFALRAYWPLPVLPIGARSPSSARQVKPLPYAQEEEMAGSVNKVILVGNLGADPEVKSFQNGGRIANLRIATSESWKDAPRASARSAPNGIRSCSSPTVWSAWPNASCARVPRSTSRPAAHPQVAGPERQ
jgi:hypothetical protein